jgi:hypothetical protein
VGVPDPPATSTRDHDAIRTRVTAVKGRVLSHRPTPAQPSPKEQAPATATTVKALTNVKTVLMNFGRRPSQESLVRRADRRARYVPESLACLPEVQAQAHRRHFSWLHP